MKVDKLREMSAAELSDTLDKLYKEQLNLRLQKATGQMANPALFKKLRRDVAQVKTIMHEINGAAV